jgi:hypothetical protein
MADVVSDKTGTTPSTSVEPAPLFRPTQHETLAHQRRFGLAYLVLAIGIGVAVGLAIVLIGRGSHHATTKAATFTPGSSGELGAKQIALHIGQKYRLANGRQIVGVVGERPNIENAPLSNYLIQPRDAKYPNDIAVFAVGNGIMYSMCGFGKNCALGTDTAASELLLQREALELALNTFKTDSSVDTVTTLLPPIQQGTVAVIFRRSELARWIQQPLSRLLPGTGPLQPGSVSPAEAQRIGLIENSALYLYDAVRGPDGNAILRLDPLG